ncbi:phosphoadenosine phosphosulfate reductase [Methylomarinovum tepidoasis]|uniref:Adenosine 5'-phosphosulfate reductase n=1 Tax=Methylomarinovum tepidoasis TaxID=2840183 RepID=A0AAU9CHK4_9GAMM|nr:phosphoadenylyl-sulfate reductase [Methylomarinovum sp. IN45]BCX88836.1 phosphoadenosine phosphosulfate reductase [Methylomarinovum sp. IN45]
MTQVEFDLEHWQTVLAGKKPNAILRTAFEHFENIAIAFSGAEDVVLIDLACRLHDRVKVFTLDTGRLHPETYRFIEQVRERYPIELDVLYPDAEAIRELVSHKGLFSFYRDGHQECCAIRKVGPLKRKLATLDAWITGQRRDQNPDTRATLVEVEADTAFAGRHGRLIKFNPLCNWTSQQVWDHIEAFEVPYNALHRHGFRSIGCEPCTRPTLPHQPEREGRWWWEDSAKKECGLHRKPQ